MNVGSSILPSVLSWVAGPSFMRMFSIFTIFPMKHV